MYSSLVIAIKSNGFLKFTVSSPPSQVEFEHALFSSLRFSPKYLCYIFEALAAAGEKKTVMVTHNGVSPISIHEKFRGDSLNCAFMTDLSSEIIDHGPDLWIHGHTHNSFDYALGKTRVIVNPYGYKDVEVNPQYDKQLLIEL